MADVTVINSGVHQDLKTCLSKQKKGDKDLYKHVSSVMSHIVKHCPQDALNKVEEVSYLIKHKDSIPMDQFLKTSMAKDYAQPSDPRTIETTKPYIDKSKTFFAVSLSVC